MGITPITSLSPLSVAREIQRDLDPLPMARVEDSARTGDETYTPGNGESAGGSEENGSEDDDSEGAAFEGELADPDREDELRGQGQEDGAEESSEPGENNDSRPISFFA